MSHHGMQAPRGMSGDNFRERPEAGRFGKLFPNLPRLISDPKDLQTVGMKGGPMDQGQHGAIGTTDTPLGYVFLGQLIDHDITLDVTSSFDKLNDPRSTKNFRTPVLDLDCIYGAGPEASPHLYYHAPPNPTQRQKQINGKHLLTLEDDLVRALSESDSNPNRAALIGDPRNDENRVVSQLQLTMHYFHNAVVDQLINDGLPDNKIFKEAQRITRWHYQWVVVRDFLLRIVGKPLVDDILCNGRKIFHCEGQPFIPIEFAAAAYRFGHTMVTMNVKYNNQHQDVELFGPELGNGFSANSAGPVEWNNFFGGTAQTAGAIDIRLPQDLLDLPFLGADVPAHQRSLAIRNLLRAQSFGLPSGQNVRAAISAVCDEDLPMPSLHGLGLPNSLVDCTPLWLYIIAEGNLSQGQQLGPVGGRIVAEVLIGLLECDTTSYLGNNRAWMPHLSAGEWDMPALIQFAGYGI